LPDAIGEPLVELLVARGDADRLGTLAAGGDRALAKRARRGLHLLRARGVQAEIPRAQATARVAPSASVEEEPASIASTPIRDGERLVWYARASEGGVEVHQARMTEEEGLTRYEVGLPTRREWREACDEVLGDPLLAAARVPPRWARWLLEEAYRRALDAGRSPPRRYAEVRHLLDKTEPPARHPALERLAGQAPPAEAAPRGTGLAGARKEPQSTARVLQLPEVTTWIPDEAAARRAYGEIEKLASSPLVLEPRQRAAQVRELLLRACDEALGGPWRARLERRLQDLAFHLLCRAASPHADRARDFTADAALAAAAAAEVADASRSAERQPVAFGLFEKLVPAEPPPEPTRAPGGGLIVTP
jgi:hypothetical protein